MLYKLKYCMYNIYRLTLQIASNMVRTLKLLGSKKTLLWVLGGSRCAYTYSFKGIVS